MKKLFLFVALMLAICTTVLSQTQMNNWYIGPKKIDMTVSSPVPATINPAYGSTFAATATHIANGFYDNYTSATVHGNLIFYIADGTVYDYNNTAIGNIPNGGAEVAIVPFGTNSSVPCQRKYNLFSTAGGITSPVGLWQTELDMNSYSLSTPVQIDGVSFGTEFGALAVSKTYGAALDRYLYFMGGSGTINSTAGQINKLIIHNNGTVSTSVPLYPNPGIGVSNSNAGGEVFTKELELSPDGKWLAWASFAQVNNPFGTQSRYHFLALNGNGDLDIAKYGTVNVYQKFNITGANYNVDSSGFRGIEFYKDASGTKLFMGAGTDGIYSTPVAIPFTSAFTQVSGSNNANLSLSFGFSQIELANNGYMYASSLSGGGGNNIGAFLPSSVAPQILSANSFPFANPPGSSWLSAGLYTLPDQIDGQNYTTIVPQPLVQVATTNNFNFNTGTATWMSGANP